MWQEGAGNMVEDEKWSSAAFVAMSLLLTPEQMEAVVGIPPSRSHRIGDPVSKHRKTPTRDRHYYSIQSKSNEAEGMEVHIDEILMFLEPRIESIKKLASEAELCLFCGFSSGNGQGGFSLSPEIIFRLSKLGLEVVLDLYPPDAVYEAT